MAWRAGWVAEDAVQQDAAFQDSASDQNNSDGGETGRRKQEALATPNISRRRC